MGHTPPGLPLHVGQVQRLRAIDRLASDLLGLVQTPQVGKTQTEVTDQKASETAFVDRVGERNPVAELPLRPIHVSEHGRAQACVHVRPRQSLA